MAKNKRNKREKKGKKFFKQILSSSLWPKISALFFWLISLILFLSFLKKAGPGGFFFLKGTTFLFGKSVYLLPIILFGLGLLIFKTKYLHYLPQFFLAIFFLISGLTGILSLIDQEERAGGIFGFLLSWPLLRFFDILVTQIIFLIFIIISFFIFWHIFKRESKEKLLPPSVSLSVKKPLERKFTPKKIKKAAKKIFLFPKLQIKKPKPTLKISAEQKLFKALQRKKEEIAKEKFLPYPLELLEPERGKPESGDINKNAEIIKNTLENFGIPVEMGAVHIGPTVTQYTLKPAEGIKLSKITTLNNNLALALAAHPIRIEAPIPGKALVGIEVPNKERAEVRLRNLLERPEFQDKSFPLMIALGRDVAGQPAFADLAKMPHLLVAGATGTGKTIFLNSLILSLLQKNSPLTLRFILIDPKRVEFAIYRSLPHLLGPVIFDAQKAVLILKWLIDEMERRFNLLSKFNVRDIASYNKALAKQKKEEILEDSIMPYIILIVDELADLMVAKGKEMELGIVRLAQMSRAVGIHLVIATQRPSVEVLTGLIKANITTRITFQVATQVDSRTVLDMAGAEKLLGSGDMLYLSAQSPKPKRIQAPFISDQEVKRVVDWLENQKEYLTLNSLQGSLIKVLEEGVFEEKIEEELPPAEKTIDPLYDLAKKTVLEARKASASLLQRRLSIGYARAARLLDLLEKNGIIGPAEGAKPRKVYGEKLLEENDFRFPQGNFN